MATSVQEALNIEFDAHEYHLSAAEEQKCRDALDGLARQVEYFPVSDLRVLIEGSRSNDVNVKLTLVLPGATLVAEDHDILLQPAFDRALDSLLKSLEAYKDRLERMEDRQKTEKRTHQAVHPTFVPDTAALDAAVEAGDFVAFRAATLPVEEELRMRVGRWIQRYPHLNDVVGDSIEIADVLEEVFLIAFEQYHDRPLDVPFGTWLENLIDPALKMLEQHPDEELENISLARTQRDAVEGRQPNV